MLSDLERDINEGHGWELSHIAEDVASESAINLQLNTGPGLALRRFGVWSDSALVRLELCRGPTLTDGTLPIQITNLSHASDRELPQGITAFSNPTVIEDPGECFYAALFGGGEDIALAANAWQAVRDDANVLAPDTKYLIRLTNLNGNARNFSVRMVFSA